MHRQAFAYSLPMYKVKILEILSLKILMFHLIRLLDISGREGEQVRKLSKFKWIQFMKWKLGMLFLLTLSLTVAKSNRKQLK